MGIQQLAQGPNTPGPWKFAVAGAGMAVGLAAAYGLERALVGPDRAEELRADGITAVDSRQASVYAMALPFGAAAGVALGLQRRTPTSGFTTASQVAAGALLSTVAGAVINADSPKAGDYIGGIGLMSGVLGGGILVGVRDEIPQGIARLGGLALFGAALGVATPTLVRSAGELLTNARTGFEHRNDP
jgi:hypothetical protein